jgi:hypothetical protein
MNLPTVPAATDKNADAATRTYADTLIARGQARGRLPRYGTPEWVALPDTEPRKVAAVLIAAEAWRDHCSAERVAQDMADDLAEIDALLRYRMKAATADIAASPGMRYAASPACPSRAELAARRKGAGA